MHKHCWRIRVLARPPHPYTIYYLFHSYHSHSGIPWYPFLANSAYGDPLHLIFVREAEICSICETLQQGHAQAVECCPSLGYWFVRSLINRKVNISCWMNECECGRFGWIKHVITTIPSSWILPSPRLVSCATTLKKSKSRNFILQDEGITLRVDLVAWIHHKRTPVHLRAVGYCPAHDWWVSKILTLKKLKNRKCILQNEWMLVRVDWMA
jgi:hypothetical protein